MLFCRELEYLVIYAFLVLIFWGQICIYAIQTAFCISGKSCLNLFNKSIQISPCFCIFPKKSPPKSFWELSWGADQVGKMTMRVSTVAKVFPLCKCSFSPPARVSVVDHPKRSTKDFSSAIFYTVFNIPCFATKKSVITT